MPTSSDHAVLMDNIYRYQRYIYDITRKYYLLGRDRILREMDVRPGDTVLEMGCGTARNLLLLAKQQPNAYYYGLDASNEMLVTAEQKVKRAGFADRIALRPCLAEEADFNKTFGLDEPFDYIFFSYALSMIPTWEDALQTALNNLKPGGWIYIVDFCDQQALPAWFRKLLTWWLSLFHVKHEPALLKHIQSLQGLDPEHTSIDFIYGRYAFIARLKKP